MKKALKDTLIGAHTSAAGGVHNALYEGRDIGATTIQLFTANQRQWKTRSISQDEIILWKKALEATGLQKIMSHDSYLINLGSPDPEVLARSRNAFREEIIRCMQLGISYLNFHPGAATTDSKEACLHRIVESILEMKGLFSDKEPLRLLIEATAGQGSTVGSQFEELDFLVEQLEGHVPIGVCIDTCHIFVAGYDLRTKEAVDKTISTFDQIVGLEHLYALHLNDSQKGIGSKVDRHEEIGKGSIGLDGFHAIMAHQKLRDLPKYLETPGGPDAWKREILLLRSFI